MVVAVASVVMFVRSRPASSNDDDEWLTLSSHSLTITGPSSRPGFVPLSLHINPQNHRSSTKSISEYSWAYLGIRWCWIGSRSEKKWKKTLDVAWGQGTAVPFLHFKISCSFFSFFAWNERFRWLIERQMVWMQCCLIYIFPIWSGVSMMGKLNHSFSVAHSHTLTALVCWMLLFEQGYNLTKMKCLGSDRTRLLESTESCVWWSWSPSKGMQPGENRPRWTGLFCPYLNMCSSALAAQAVWVCWPADLDLIIGVLSESRYRAPAMFPLLHQASSNQIN